MAWRLQLCKLQRSRVIEIGTVSSADLGGSSKYLSEIDKD